MPEVCCDKGTNDKGCCCCCGSYIGVWIMGVLYVLGLFSAIIDLDFCRGVEGCAGRMWSNDEFMWIDPQSGKALNWEGMTTEDNIEMETAFQKMLWWKRVTIIGYIIMIAPFIAVLSMPKSAGARMCLLIWMSIEFLVHIIFYVLSIVGTLQAATWLGEKADEIAMERG